MKLTRFQKARILAARALQISHGAPSAEAADNPIDPLEAAVEEMKKGNLLLQPGRVEGDDD